MDDVDPQGIEAAEDAGVDAGDGQGPHELELTREALTMALYLSLSLLAVLITLPEITNDDRRWAAGSTVLVAALGLLLAHHLAFRLSSRLVNEGLLTPESMLALKAQAYGGVPVALIAALPVFVLGERPGEGVSTVVLAALVAWAGYRSARKRASPLRSMLYVLVIVGAAAVVLLVKLAVGH